LLFCLTFCVSAQPNQIELPVDFWHKSGAMLPNKAEVRRYVRQCLKNEKIAPQSLGIGYKVIRPHELSVFIKLKIP
jgi:hypothetical protein